MHSTWYALLVKSKKEQIVAGDLERKQIQYLLPTYKVKRQWSDRMKETTQPLFPGYIFCSIPESAESPKILTTPGVIRFISFGKGPTPIPDQEIQMIQALMESDRALEPWPYLEAGQSIRVEHGPFKGWGGIVVRKKSESRLVVNLHFLQRAVSVELVQDDIVPLNCSLK